MKKVFAVMLVKNEQDIIKYNIEWLETQNIDHIFVANNLSSDNTRSILLDLKDKYSNITVFEDKQFAHEQGQKMNRWINECYDMGADIILPIDADEKWYSKVEGKTLGEVLKEFDGDYIFEAKAIDFIPTENDLKSDNPFESMIYTKKDSDSFSSVGFTKKQGSRITEGNHKVLNHSGKVISHIIGIKHYQYRSFDQFSRKVKNGKNTIELSSQPSYIASHWRNLGSMNHEDLLKWWNNYISQPVKLYDGI